MRKRSIYEKNNEKEKNTIHMNGISFLHPTEISTNSILCTEILHDFRKIRF
jgi:hypothetical protein